MTSDDNKLPNLPKPVTVTGSAFSEPEEENKNQVNTEVNENDELPMPAAVFDDIDEEVEPKKKDIEEGVQNKSPLDNILPEIVPASSDPVSQNKLEMLKKKEEAQDEDLPAFSLPPLVEEAKTYQNNQEIPAMTKTEGKIVENDNALLSQDPEVQNLSPNITASENPNQDFSLPQIDINTIPQEISSLNPVQNDALYDQINGQSNPQDTQGQLPQLPTTPQIQEPNMQTPHSGNNIGKVLLGIGVFLVGGGLVIGGYFGISTLINQKNSQKPTVAYQEPNITPRPIQSPQATQEASPSATAKSRPTPSPKTTPKPSAQPINEDNLKIQILNGSGKKGDALTAKSLIQTEEFEITTGNADNFDYTQTTIDYKEDYKTTASQFVKTLEKTYDDVILGEVLPDNSEFDFVITLGSGSVEATPKPSATATPKP